MTRQLSNLTYFIRGINPLSKLIIFFLLIICELLLFSDAVYKSIIVLMLLMLSIYFFSDKFSTIIKNTFRFYPMIVVLTILLPFSGNGNVLFSIMDFNIYSDGLRNFFVINLIAITILIYSNMYVKTTSILNTIKYLQKLGVSRKLLAILFLVNRFLSTIKTDILKKTMAFKSRYQRLSVMDKINYIVKFITSVFIDMFAINEKIFFALASRNFRGEITTTSKAEWSRIDFYAILFSLIIFSFLLWI